MLFASGEASTDLQLGQSSLFDYPAAAGAFVLSSNDFFLEEELEGYTKFSNQSAAEEHPKMELFQASLMRIEPPKTKSTKAKTNSARSLRQASQSKTKSSHKKHKSSKQSSKSSRQLRRCSICRCAGHNKRRCPQFDIHRTDQNDTEMGFLLNYPKEFTHS